MVRGGFLRVGRDVIRHVGKTHSMLETVFELYIQQGVGGGGGVPSSDLRSRNVASSRKVKWP